MIVSSSYMQSYLKLASTAYTSVTLLNSLISEVEAYWEGYCNQPLAARDLSYYFTGNGATTKVLPNSIVNSLMSLYRRSNQLDVWELVSASNVTLFQNEGVYKAYNDEGFVNGDSYFLFYNAGYTTIPEAVKKVVSESVAIAYKESVPGDNRLGILTKGEGQQGVSYSTHYDDLFDRFKRDIANYRIHVI